MSPVPRLHVIVPDAVAAEAAFPRTALELCRRGGPSIALHLRTRELTARALHDLAGTVTAGARRHGAWCLVNERADVALTAGAHGVQLGRGALPVRTARSLMGEGSAIGASVHSAEEARRAAGAGATFLLAGTIFSTASHPGRPPAGLERIAACSGLGPPVIAIGGMEPGRVADVLRAGAHGVATLSGVWRSEDPADATERFLEALSEAA